MHVVRAQAMGMCFGVKDALLVAQRIANPHDVTIHGELVHNEKVNDSLRQNGFQISGEVGRSIPRTPEVMITAHGVSDRERKKLQDAGKIVYDTTCPLVRRAHQVALRLASAGWHIVIAGKKGHVEVAGLAGDLHNPTIISSPEDVTLLPYSQIAVVCQTTLQSKVAAEVVEALKQKNPASEVRLFDTICRPTRERQAAMVKLLTECEAVVVVGGVHSNNTRQLVAVAKASGKPTVHVQGAQQIDEDWAAQFAVVGVTAGTSTPDEDIDAVCERLERIAPARVHAGVASQVVSA